VKIIHCDQGSTEWLQARAGVCTASMFATARKKVGVLDERQAQFVELCKKGWGEKQAAAEAGYKTLPRSDIITRALNGEKIGDWSDASKDYAFRLAIERISGMPLDEGFETWSMRRGHDLEPHARMEHELQTGLMVQRAGFVVTDDNLFGASADGLINDDGGSEYKCFIDPGRLRSIYMDDDFSEIADQAQGCMWLTGRKWWHICLYCPALEMVGKQLWWREFKRDDEFIEKMEADLWEFAMLVAQYEKVLRQQAA
jgi:hypothetical protein